MGGLVERVRDERRVEGFAAVGASREGEAARRAAREWVEGSVGEGD